MNLNQHHETASFVEGFRPELLAPAGNLDCALAPFEGGADAIYAGLPRFNARERSENFTQYTLVPSPTVPRFYRFHRLHRIHTSARM